MQVETTPAITGAARALHQFSMFESIEKTCDIRITGHHAQADLAAGKAIRSRAAQNTQYVILSRGQILLFQDAGNFTAQHVSCMNQTQEQFFFSVGKGFALLELALHVV